jgi:hypothetical protein
VSRAAQAEVITARQPQHANPKQAPTQPLREAPATALPTEVAKPQAATDNALNTLVDALGVAHARLHSGGSGEQALEAEISSALDATFASRRPQRRYATEFYKEFGAGRFVRGGALTPLGAGVVERVRALEAHAIDPKPFDVATFDALVSKLGGAPLAASVEEGAHVAALRSILEAPAFDAATVRARLATLSPLPAEASVRGASAVVAKDKPVTAADLPADTAMFRSFLQLVLDSRFVHKAGPLVLRSAEAVFEKEKKELGDFIRTVMNAEGASGLATLDPPHPQFAKMVEILAEYRQIAARGGCEKLSPSWRFRAGSKGKEVEALQRRLACQGFLESPVNGLFDDATMAAVRMFQRHHDLPEEGVVLEETMEALNVTIERRVRQLELVIQRMRESDFEHMRHYFIRVNLPSFLLKVFEDGKVIKEHRVIVGTNKLDDDKVQLVQGHINRTKLFGTRLYEVIVNPTWILPKRVEEGELQSSLEKDADYLSKSNIKRVKLGSGDEVYIQGAGKGNVLGKVKFLLEATNAIYLHDTDKRHLFKKQRRDFSHGCMRVDQAIDFGKWILERDGFSPAEIDKAFSLASLQQPFDLKKPVDLVTEYMTVDLSGEGRPVFYDDIYGYDSAYWNDNLPPTERLRWGHSKLRPRWVPLMESSVVDGWRASGKPAPRNLGPDGKPKKDAKGGDAAVDSGP